MRADPDNPAIGRADNAMVLTGTVGGYPYTYNSNKKGWLRRQLDAETASRGWNLNVVIQLSDEEKNEGRIPEQHGFCEIHKRPLDFVGSGPYGYKYDCDECFEELAKFGIDLRYIFAWKAMGAKLPPHLEARRAWCQDICRRIRK